MANVDVQKIPDTNKAPVGILEEVDRAFQQVRERAFQIFSNRDSSIGDELDDWLRAERELAVCPASELIEREKEYQLQIPVPGMSADDLEVSALPHQLVIQGKHTAKETQGKTTSISSQELFRSFELGGAIDMNGTSAKVDKGVLTITAPKAGKASVAAA
jgi:HSP20 family molecular chaperone IbpA